MNEKSQCVSAGSVIDQPWLRDRTGVFRDRVHAGEVLAEMLQEYRNTEAIVLAIPAGGVPVAAAVAEKLALPLDIAVVSKITLPWNTEAGYGAVAFDGTVSLNEDLISALRLTKEQIQQGIDQTRRKVERRIERLRGAVSFPDLSRRPAILIDDGLASGFTMLAAMKAVHEAGAGRIIVAVPTGNTNALRRVAKTAAGLYCANVRGGAIFAVADAYEYWSDVDEEETVRILSSLSSS